MMEEIFDDLLRFIFPAAESLVDMERGFDFLDKELSELYPEPEKVTDTRYVDKLVKVHRADGGEELFLVHIEVQGYPDKFFPERMFRYFYRIFDRYQKPVTALAIFTGEDGKNMPDCYTHSFMGTYLTYRYNTFCIMDCIEADLESSDNPFAMVALASKRALLAGKIPESAFMEQKLLIARLLLKRNYSRKKIEAILTFLKNYMLFEYAETNRIFDQRLDQLTGKIYTMGIIEQVAELRAEERAEQREKEVSETFVKRLLTETELSLDKIASLTSVPISTVEKIKASL